MAKKEKKGKKRKDFDEPHQQIQNALLFETPRGTVLVGHGQLDDMLEGLLRARFSHPSKDTDAQIQLLLRGALPPLGSFYIRTVMARVLRLIDGETFAALTALNDLRNHFAHHPGEVSLNHERVDGIYEQLNDAAKKEIAESASAFTSSPNEAPKMRFMQVALALMRILETATNTINQQT